MGTYSNKNNGKPTFEELTSRTKQELTNEAETQIRVHAATILEILGKHDVSVSIEKSIPEMDKDGVDNFSKVKHYIFTLVDVIRLSR